MDASNGAHAAGNDDHPPGPVAPTGDTGGLIIPAMAGQFPALDSEPVSPELTLLQRINGDGQALFRTEDLMSTVAEDKMNCAPSLQQQLKGTLGKGLGRCTGNGQNVCITQRSLRATAAAPKIRLQ